MNDINLAALGEQWQGVARGVDDFAFLSVGTGLGIGLVLGGELHSGRHGAAGEIDYALLGFGRRVRPFGGGGQRVRRGARAERGGWRRPWRRRTSRARSSPPPAPAIALAQATSSHEVARRIALHIAPVAAVADVGLVVLGGGIGANGDLLLEPIREMLARWLPYPPRLEISSLGEAAVLSGALAVGLRTALDAVFVNRTRTARG